MCTVTEAPARTVPGIVWWDNLSLPGTRIEKGWIYFSDHTRLGFNLATPARPVFPDFQDCWHPEKVVKRHFYLARRFLGGLGYNIEITEE